ncbi:anti-sigma regulatory factor [Streptomyces spiroverticillatus]|uniref:Anti-sigma regulatory factor n=1 Tax=Streptomyces finlayi TaxID=67296 RepID=A0A918X5N0_9ACTN|nr:sensor histidine kinase [Streptomyces finlayi]GHA39210.1 anti-sigma regulatory factor [Streptomyces spiroverticillatus]GHD14121.1 anti-sigma regulatory factor [Streptomyces finlayi]
MTTRSRVTAVPGHRFPFFHPAFFYTGPDSYREGVGGFVRDAVADGRPVLVAVPGPRLALLQGFLGPARADVTWEDMTRAGRNPGRILSLIQQFADRADGARVSIVGEPIWVGRTPAEALEATRHEALINVAFAGREADILCPYDTALPADVLDRAHRTHPFVGGPGPYRPSTRYTDPHKVCRDLDHPLPEPRDAVSLAFDVDTLGRTRDAASAWAQAAGLTYSRRADWLLAVGEALSNSVRHGGGRGVLRMWCEDRSVIAEISDQGRLADPLTGRRRPDPFAPNGGRGMWIIHQLCDLVEVRATEQGLVLRLHLETA